MEKEYDGMGHVRVCQVLPGEYTARALFNINPFGVPIENVLPKKSRYDIAKE